MKQNMYDLQNRENEMPFLQKEIDALKKESTKRSGCWEIDWGPEPISQALGNGESQLILTMVVHQESYFIIDTRVSPADELSKGVLAFVAAARKQFTLPDVIAVRDKSLRDELMPLAAALGCEIQVTRLKAIPQIRRDMRRLV